MGVRLHDDAGLCAIHAGLPRPFTADLAVVVELGGIFSEVPDVASLVLREVVERLFCEYPVLHAVVLDHDDGYAVDDLGPVRDGDRVDERPVRTYGDEGRARFERREGIVDDRGEVVGNDRRGRTC
jgi:hypothetical protein